MAEDLEEKTIFNISKEISPMLDGNAIQSEFEFKNFLIYSDLTRNGPKADIFKVSLLDMNTMAETKVVIKRVPQDGERRSCVINKMFQNEIHFYSNVYPQLKALEHDQQVLERFNPLPEFIVSDSELYNKMVVLKDLSFEGYEMRASEKQDEILEEHHFQLAIKAYGHFHAMSFYLKHQNPEIFQKLAEPYDSILETTYALDALEEDFQSAITIVLNMLDYNETKEIVAKLESYLTNIREIFLDAIKYDGKYGCLLHGECNPSNMMFKYNRGSRNVEAVKFVDFHFARFGSPVHDLSQFFYLEAIESYTRLKDYKRYIGIYYDSFRTTARRLNIDPQILLPKKRLQEDWKKYSKSSFLLAIRYLKHKYIDVKRPEDNPDRVFNIHLCDIVKHMYDIGAL